MPRPRKSLICLANTPYYHCVSRCVRRAFLCGKDHYTGKCYEHRRKWVEKRLLKLAGAFAIDICAYAVMSNHTHVVLHVDKEKAIGMDGEEVLQRWHTLQKGTLLTRKYMDKQQRAVMSEAEIEHVLSCVAIYRKRLYDISWFMRLLNEYIARMANKEDECTGRFWEGRFKSQALLDEGALLACMAYVDLNPIRAGKALRPESSLYTSIKLRVACAQKRRQPRSLMQFDNGRKDTSRKSLPFQLKDYLELVDQSGRALMLGKPGCIATHCEPILLRTGLAMSDWAILSKGIESHFANDVSVSIARKKRIA
ncbi:transposase [Alteromonas sp. 345S023]|uniref:Transposase n=1 Tax=Alteromonas profundi TaxID=2696062 RepID=A0A7X5LJP8_9ALTE|nr:transposase [Alteromonas profundi]NDV90229.1 transposase [Alteromonas profundi]